MSSKSSFLAVLVATLALACGTPALGGKPPAPSYQILQLDLVDDDNVEYATSNASDITNPNESAIPRQVVGSVGATSDQDIPACWTTSVVDGTVQSELHVLELPTASGQATGVNDGGQIVGAGWDGSQPVGLYWASYGVEPEPLLPLLNDTVTYAYAINNDGVICGCSGHAVYVDDRDGNPVFDHYEYRPVVWRVNAVDIFGPVELPGSQPDCASAINDNDAAGWATVVGTLYSALAWTVQSQADGSLTLGQFVVLDSVGRAEGVNRTGTQGTVCGGAETSNPLLQAVVWTGSTKLALKGARFYITRAANDINDQGVIVGWAEYTKNLSGSLRAVMWSSATGSMVLLNQFLDDNSPLTSLSWANAVNNYGEIVGFGYAGPLCRAFIAIPK